MRAGSLPLTTAATFFVSTARTFDRMSPRIRMPNGTGRKSRDSEAANSSSTFLPANPSSFSPASRVIQPASVSACSPGFTAT